MAKKSNCVLLIPVFLTFIFLGLFFAVTDPTSWLTRKTILTATDMNLIPPVSTLWCESIVLNSSHDFVAYKVDKVPSVTSKLSRNSIDVETKLERRNHKHLEIKYFMLPGSVLNVFACASQSYAYLRVYEGSIKEGCACSLRESLESDEFDSEEDNEEDVEDNEKDEGFSLLAEKFKIKKEPGPCVKPLRTERLSVGYDEDCRNVQPISINVTKPDYFTVLLTSNNPSANRVKVKLSLDRTLYNVSKSEESIYHCGGPNTCSVPLRFASKERIVVWIPLEQDAGTNLFIVESRCYPRIALFAFLTFALPCLLFGTLAYLLIKSPILSRSFKNTISSADSGRRAYSSPLLERPSCRDEVFGHDRNAFIDVDRGGCMPRNEPPSYERLFGDPPPPYSSLKSKSGTAEDRNRHHMH